MSIAVSKKSLEDNNMVLSVPTLKAELIRFDDDIVRFRVLCDQCEATHKSFPRRRESSGVREMTGFPPTRE